VEYILIVYDAPPALLLTLQITSTFATYSYELCNRVFSLAKRFSNPWSSAHNPRRKLTVNPSSSLTCRATRASTPPTSLCLLSLSTKTGLGLGVGVQASFSTLPSCEGNLGLTEDALFLALCWTHLTNSAIALLSDIGRDRTFDRGVVIGITTEAPVRAGVTGGTCRGSGRMGRVLVVEEEGWPKAWGGGIQVHPHHLSGTVCSMVLVV
jgi:hypothetical protein